MKWARFQVYFSNSVCVIGPFAHASLLARGRSSASTTYYPLWATDAEIGAALCAIGVVEDFHFDFDLTLSINVYISFY